MEFHHQNHLSAEQEIKLKDADFDVLRKALYDIEKAVGESGCKKGEIMSVFILEQHAEINRLTGMLAESQGRVAELERQLEPKSIKELIEHEAIKVFSAKQINDALVIQHRRIGELEAKLAARR